MASCRLGCQLLIKTRDPLRDHIKERCTLSTKWILLWNTLHLGVSKFQNRGPSYSTLNSRIIIIRTPEIRYALIFGNSHLGFRAAAWTALSKWASRSWELLERWRSHPAANRSWPEESGWDGPGQALLTSSQRAQCFYSATHLTNSPLTLRPKT